jgi:hypothetical protein
VAESVRGALNRILRTGARVGDLSFNNNKSSGDDADEAEGKELFHYFFDF